MNGKMNVAKCIDENLSELYTTNRQYVNIINSVNGGVKTKGKFKMIPVLAAILVMLAAVGLALGLRYSPKAVSVLTAREAVMQKYGLTSDMMRMFGNEIVETQGDKTITSFSCTVVSPFTNGEAMGTYTVTEDKNGNKTAAWSHDDADKAIWQGKDLTAPIWGAEQLQQTIERYALYDAWNKEHYIELAELPPEEQAKLNGELAELIAPLSLDRHELVDPPYAETAEAPIVISAEAPMPTARPNDIAAEQAIQIARQAMAEAYSLTEQELDTYENEVMYRYGNEDTCMVMFYGTETMGNVVLNSTDGEVQEVELDSPVGGNG